MAEDATLSRSAAVMSLSEGSDGDPAQRQTRPNLPLPRELRDQIWRYLLQHVHVHEEPYRERAMSKQGATSQKNGRAKSGAHTFKFHTSILAVNHLINEECSKVLQSNGFVITVASDLPRFCRMVENRLLRVQAFAPRVCGDAKALYGFDVQDHGSGNGAITVHTNIKIENNGVSLDFAKRVLSNFHHVVHSNQQIAVLGWPEGLSEHVAKLQEVTTPKTIWIKAMAWHILQDLNWELTETKTAAEAGDLENAAERYASVAYAGCLQFLFNFPTQDACDSEADIPIALMSLLLLDAGVMQISLRMRLAGGDDESGTATVYNDLHFLCRFIIAIPDRALWIALLMSGAKPSRAIPSSSICRALWYGSTMQDFWKGHVLGASETLEFCLPSLQGDSNFDHDYTLVKELSQNGQLPNTIWTSDDVSLDPVQRMNVLQIPLQIYHNEVLDTLETLAGLEGFVDHAHLAELKEKFPGKYDNL